MDEIASEEAATPKAKKDWVQWAALALVAVHFGLAVGRCIYPYDNDASYMTFGVSKELASGLDPWDERHVLEAPFVAPLYGPVLHGLGALGWALFGRQFWFLRAASLCGFVVSLFALHRIGRRGSGGQHGAWLSILIFVSFTNILQHTSGGRGDMAALGFAALGISLLLDAPLLGSGAFVVAGLLCGMAPLVKQVYVAPIAVGSLFCLLRRSRAQTAAFLSGAVGLPLVVFGVLDWLSHGGFWRMAVIYPSLSPRSFGHLVSLLRQLAHDPAWDLAMFVLAWGILEVARRPRATLLPAADRDLVLAMWLPLVLVQDLLMGSRELSPGYWLELWFVVSATVPALLAAVKPSASSWLLRMRDAFPVLLLLAGLLADARELHGQYFEWKAIPYFESMVAFVRERAPANEPCLTEYSDIPERAGRDVLFNDYGLYALTTKENRDLLQAALDEGRFSLLLLQPVHDGLYSTERYARVATPFPVPIKVGVVAPYIRKDLLTPGDILVPRPTDVAETRRR